MRKYKKLLKEKEKYGSTIEICNRSKFQKQIIEESQKYAEVKKSLTAELEDNSITSTD